MQVLSDTPAPPAAGAFDEPCPGLLLDPDRSSYPSPLSSEGPHPRLCRFMAELIDFFKNEVGVSNKALHRLEESEIDGAILDITLDSEDGDEALMETLKIDALTVRKLRRKLIEMDHDYEAEEHEEELLNFFKQIVVDNKGTTLVCVRVNRVCLDVPFQ